MSVTVILLILWLSLSSTYLIVNSHLQLPFLHQLNFPLATIAFDFSQSALQLTWSLPYPEDEIILIFMWLLSNPGRGTTHYSLDHCLRHPHLHMKSSSRKIWIPLSAVTLWSSSSWSVDPVGTIEFEAELVSKAHFHEQQQQVYFISAGDFTIPVFLLIQDKTSYLDLVVCPRWRDGNAVYPGLVFVTIFQWIKATSLRQTAFMQSFSRAAGIWASLLRSIMQLLQESS